MSTGKKLYEFDPDWVVALGETLREWSCALVELGAVLPGRAAPRKDEGAVTPDVRAALVERVAEVLCDEQDTGECIPEWHRTDAEAVVDALTPELTRPCPHIVTDEEGTSYCGLAATTDRLDAVLVHVCQRIRAGWLPHRLSAGGWWWGRPDHEDGFHLWSEGYVPCMRVVEPMSTAEVDAWVSTLHEHAPELLAEREARRE